MINLVEVLKQLQSKINKLQNDKIAEIKKVEQSYETEINKYKQALEINMELNEACLHCEGTGRVYCDDGYQSNSRENCKECNGSGKNK
jgi:vacuolar-type H+-ATPase subunit I/STV1